MYTRETALRKRSATAVASLDKLDGLLVGSSAKRREFAKNSQRIGKLDFEAFGFAREFHSLSLSLAKSLCDRR